MRKTIIIIAIACAAMTVAACGGVGTAAPVAAEPAVAQADITFCHEQADKFLPLRSGAEAVRSGRTAYIQDIAFRLDTGREARAWLGTQLLEDTLLVATAQVVDATLQALTVGTNINLTLVDTLLTNLDRFDTRCAVLQGR